MARLDPPKDLDVIARRAWRSLTQEHPHLSTADGPLLRVYAIAVSTMEQAGKRLSAEGLTVRTARGVAKHPAASILHESSQRITRCLRELRCSPSTREVKSEDGEQGLVEDIRFTVTG